MKLFLGVGDIPTLAQFWASLKYLYKLVAREQLATGIRKCFFKTTCYLSQCTKHESVPNLLQDLCDPYQLEVREKGHEVISRSWSHTQFFPDVGIIARPIQPYCQTATCNLESECVSSKERVISSQCPKRESVPNLVQEIYDPYQVEVREMGHEVFSRRQRYSHISSVLEIIASPIQIVSTQQLATWNEKVLA